MKSFFARFRKTRSVPVFLLLPLLLALGLWFQALSAHAATFPANQCPADRYGDDDDLVCTANDVSITGMAVVGDTTSCVGGTNITLDLQMTVNFAVPDRWDIGIFISNDGKSPQTLAANGGAATCSVSVLPTASPFLNLDGGATGDTCGDGNGSIGGGTGSGVHYMPNVTVPCQSLPGASGKLYIPFVVSWDNQSSPSGDLCTSNRNPVPNTKSKCNAPTVVQGSVDVVVLPSITMTDNKTTIFSGGTTTYTVVVTNTTGVSLSGVVFTDPAVSGITMNSISCSPAGGASCPASSTVAAMQGAGITIPTLPAGGSVTFSIGATLTGSPSDTRTNTATVTASSQSNTASDTDTIVDTIAILPSTLAQNGDKGATVTYSYTVYNYGVTSDTISLAVASSQGWTVSRSPTSVTVAAGGSATVTVTVSIPSGASIGTVDTTTLTATSGVAPSENATATAVTTVTAILTLTPNNTGAGGAGSYVNYSHRVQNNASTTKSVSLTPIFSGCTGTWTSALYESNGTTALTSPVSLSGNGGYKDFVLRVGVPLTATNGATCTATLTAAFTSGAANSVSVTDVTTVKNLVLYEDAGYATAQDTYPAGNRVYAKAYGLTLNVSYYYVFLDSTGAVVCRDPSSGSTLNVGTTWTSSCLIPDAGPLGTWTAQVWRDAATDTLFDQANFYVGPDHLKASYTGANPAINTDTVIDLALHDKTNHVVPFDAASNLVKGSPTDTEGPLMVTVTVSGSASIVSSTLLNAVISGQSVTGKLSSSTGTATVTINDAVAETVTVTPASYKGKLYGSTARDEAASVTFVTPPLDHIRIEHTGTGVTCLSSTVTVKACVDAACSTLSPDSATVTLLPAGGWGATNTITFTGSTTASLSITTPQTVTLGTSAVTPSPSGTSPRCFVGGTETCSLVFADTGFVFSATADGGSLTIPTQTAGVGSSTYYLRAVKKDATDPPTQACTAALTGPTTVNFAHECVNSATCYTSDLMSVNGGTNTTIARNDGGSVSSYTSVPMTFDANGNAPFTFNYADVGQVKLWVSKPASGSLLASLTGSSNVFVVKPHGFVLGGIKCTTADAAHCGAGALAMATPGDNPAAANASGVTFIRAGDPFSVTVAATANGGAATPNFGNEDPHEWVRLSPALVAGLGLTNNPSTSVDRTTTGGIASGTSALTVGSSAGYAVNDRVRVAGAGAAGADLITTVTAVPTGTTMTLAASASTTVAGSAVHYMFPAFSAGAATGTNFTWDEVGIITLTPSLGDGDYLGAGAVTGTASGNVGRFYPHHFDLTSTLLPPTLTNRSDLPGAAAWLRTGSITSGSTLLTISSASNLAVGDSLVVAGAGTNGGALTAKVSVIVGNLLTLDTAAVTTVANAYVGFPNGFTYMDETFGLSFELTAKNATGGTTGTTANYVTSATAANNFAKLDAASAAWLTLGTNGSIGVGAVNGTTPLLTRLAVSGTPTSPSGGFVNGVGSFSANVQLIARTVSPTPLVDGPYDLMIVGIAPQDNDGIKLAAFNVNTLGTTAAPERSLIGVMRERFGRLRLINAYGSELLPARVEYRAEYWDGSRWTTNTLDSTTALVAGNLATDGLTVGTVGALANGVGFITFNVAGVGVHDIAINLNAGGVDKSCNASHGGTAANIPWLQGYWSGSCGGVVPWAQDPNARIKLGSPQAPYIYLRELY